MSIMQSLIRLVDPIQARQQEEERKRAREEPRRTHDGNPPRFKCRVCGHESEDKAFCSECLAETLQPLR
jgi:hypothetical protein